ncbi:AMP-dependent synthetase [Alicycliphilus sp. B1]|nr:AMP-dependent synthetase [Alicycliphilus sp. B1]
MPLAAVVLPPGPGGHAGNGARHRRAAAEVLARLKLPQRMVFVDALPRLETGKLLRRQLKERFREQPQAGFALRDS